MAGACVLLDPDGGSGGTLLRVLALALSREPVLNVGFALMCCPSACCVVQRIIPKIFNEEGGAHEEKGEHARLVLPRARSCAVPQHR